MSFGLLCRVEELDGLEGGIAEWPVFTVAVWEQLTVAFFYLCGVGSFASFCFKFLKLSKA